MEQTAKERTLAFMAEHAGDPTPMELFHMHVKHVGINTKYEGGEPRNLRPYWLWRK